MTERTAINKYQEALDQKRQERADNLRPQFTDHRTGVQLISEEMLRSIGDAVATKTYAKRFPQQPTSHVKSNETNQ